METLDTTIGYEICEELWNPARYIKPSNQLTERVDIFLITCIPFGSTHISLGLDGIEFIVNGSGSYFELRKANVAVDLVLGATRKSGGCYLFSNLRGCDGQRIMFNGGSCIALNGQTIARTRQFSLEEVVRNIIIQVTCFIAELTTVFIYRKSPAPPSTSTIYELIAI